MKNHVDSIKELPLFHGIKEEALLPMFTCLGTYCQSYKKGEFVCLFSEPVRSVGIILEGTIHMIKEDVWGNKTILAFIKKGELFGETFACGSHLTSTVSFYAATDCKVFYMPFHKVLHACNRSCVFHHRLIENMVQLIADKNVLLMEKIEITSQKTLREKILTYLSLQSQLHRSYRFEIPLGRLELADYLCANRSALTRELNHMREEKLIDFERNHFQLLKKQ